MELSDCTSCADLREVVQITSPGQLAQAVRVVRGHLADGTLVEVSRDIPGYLGLLQERGPWPDYIEHEFSCSCCGQRFRPVAGAYHGAGGRWEPVVEARGTRSHVVPAA